MNLTLFDLDYYSVSRPPADKTKRWCLVAVINGVKEAFVTGHDNGGDEWDVVHPTMRTPRLYKSLRGANVARQNRSHPELVRVERWTGKPHAK